MKKKFLLSILVFSIFVSCNTSDNQETKTKSEPVKTTEEIIRANVEDYLQDKLHDPKSYEFVNLIVLDTISYKENIETFRSMTNSDIETAKILKNQSDIKKYNERIRKMAEIEKSLGDSLFHTAAYLYSFKFRANNKMGALTLHDYFVQLTCEPEYSVLNMTSDYDKLYLTPNTFPGYQKLFNE